MRYDLRDYPGTYGSGVNVDRGPPSAQYPSKRRAKRPPATVLGSSRPTASNTGRCSMSAVVVGTRWLEVGASPK